MARFFLVKIAANGRRQPDVSAWHGSHMDGGECPAVCNLYL